jgi:hypothetical protein
VVSGMCGFLGYVGFLGAAPPAFGGASPLRYGFAVAHTFTRFAGFGTALRAALRIASPSARSAQARGIEAEPPKRQAKRSREGDGARSHHGATCPTARAKRAAARPKPLNFKPQIYVF